MKIYPVVALLAAVSTGVQAIGCYSGGITFNELRDNTVDGTITWFCANMVPYNVPSYTNFARCFRFGSNNMFMSISNKDNYDKRFTYEECVAAFRREQGGCSHGSEQWALGIFIRIDPNDGACSI